MLASEPGREGRIIVRALALDEDGPTRRKFLARLQGEISKREHEYGGVKVTEASLNRFPSSQIADRIQEDRTVS